MKEKGAWVPLTPAIHFPSIRGAIKASNHDADCQENPQFPPILGDSGRGFGNFGRQGVPKVAENMGGSLSIDGASDCAKCADDHSGVVRAKTGFLVSANSENADEEANQETPDGFKWMEGNQPYNHHLHDEFGTDSTKASSTQKNQIPRKRSNKGIDLNKQPQKRMRMKKHRPKVFDESKPKKTSTSKPQKSQTPKPKTPKPRTPRNAKYVKKERVNIPVDSMNDVGRRGRGKSSRGKSSSRRKLDFCRGDYIMSGNGVDLELKKESLSILVDSLKDASSSDLDTRSSGQNLVFSMESSIMDQNSNASNGDNETEVKKQDLNIPIDSLKDATCCRSSSRQSPHFSMESCIMDQNSKATNEVENEIEVELKKQDLNIPVYCFDLHRSSTGQNLDFKINKNSNPNRFEVGCGDRFNGMKVYQRRYIPHPANRLSSLKVYQRKFPQRNREREREREEDGIGNERELESEGPLDHRLIGFEFSKRKIVPKFPNLYKRIRKRRQRAGVDKLIKLVWPISCPQRQRSKQIEENSKKKFSTACVSNEKIPKIPRKEVEYSDKCTLNCTCTWIRTGKRNRFRIHRRNFSCLSILSPNKATKATLRRKRSRRKEFSSLINLIRKMQEYIIHKQSPELDNRDFIPKALLDYLVGRMESLHIGDVLNKMRGQGELVTSKVKFGPLKKRKQLPKVDLDPETMRVWNLLMESSHTIHLLMESGQSENAKQQEDNKAKYWEVQREIFSGRVESFIARMCLIQGDRRFSRWKGSVVDSVVGVFLTQNVSDHLSSSAFMNLASKYPPSLNKDRGCDYKSDYVNEIQHIPLGEQPSNELSIVENYPSTRISKVELPKENDREKHENLPKENAKKQENKINWDDLRTKYSHGKSRNRPNHTLDSVNWEAVRQAPVKEVAKVIMERGMNNMLAQRIKDFLDRLVTDHGSIDLEWLRDVEPDKGKEYLLSITGLGLKSVECVRLLTLRHHAFPVDTNVARILVRLGWVPLQPLPGDLQIHLLNDYPLLENVQKYIWPRLCHLMIDILYELHYHLITFGKIFCTKRQPNCNACPMRAECRHYASAYASAKLKLDAPKDKHMTPPESFVAFHVEQEDPHGSAKATYQYHSINCEPIVQHPPSPEPLCIEIGDIEDMCYEFNDEDIPTIKLNSKEFTEDMNMADEEVTKALIALTPEVASLPTPKLKDVRRLRTVHYVYELPDGHPLLVGYEKREPDDRCPYLLAMWSSNELMDSVQNSTQGSNNKVGACCSGEIVQYQNDEIVRGTILIPIRTANRGSFPLNGTYFQVNEVIADQESSKHPITVPRHLIWNLNRRPLYCGTSATSICRGMSMPEVLTTCRLGFMCIRGFDRVTRAPRPLARRFHLCKTRKVDDEDS